MTRRRERRGLVAPPAHVPIDHGWQTADTYTLPSGRVLTPGVEFTVRGERGRFRFLRHVRRSDGVEWLDAIGGTEGVRMWRSFRPDRVRRVFRPRPTRSAA